MKHWKAAPAFVLFAGAAMAADSLSFFYQVGSAAPPAQSVAIACGTTGAPFTATVSSGGWLRVSPSSGAAPATLAVSVEIAGLQPGFLTGSIAIAASAACGGNRIVSVGLLVGAPQPMIASALTLGAGSLSFTAIAGGGPPPAQTVPLTCAGAAGPFTATANSSGWLVVNPRNGTAPATLTVSVNPAGLGPGTFSGSIVATAGGCGAAPPLPVTLIVAANFGSLVTGLIVSPASLAFTYQTGAANPPAQALSAVGVAGSTFTLATSNAGWLVVDRLSGTAPGSVMVSVDPAGLTAGGYSAVIVVASAAAGSQSVRVTLTVSGGVLPPPVVITGTPRIMSLVNAASLLSSPLAPGEIISIFGSGLGPDQEQQLRLTPFNVVDTSLAGTQVIINGKAAPVLYTRSGQVNTIVPYSAAGRSTVQVRLEYQGVAAALATFSVDDAAPAIFTINGSGRGQGAILNEDTSVNSDLNPADRGRVAVLYASGAGVMIPASEDGAITGTTLARPVLQVSVLVDGQIAFIEYAGAAPGLVAGALQVNFRIPPQVRAGSAVGVLLKVGRFTSQAGVTLAIR